jgi:alanine dehydrogenase
MIVGTVREIKNEEFRVGLTPEGAHALVDAGHTVVVEKGAGTGILASDERYCRAGAEVVEHAREVWERADLIVKVKEPLFPEYPLIRDNQTLFTYLHLAASPELAKVLIDSRVTAIAYETVELPDGSLPLLIPMSPIETAIALGARVTVFDTRLEKLRRVQQRWPGRTTTLMSSPLAIARALRGADVLICAVLVPGAAAPKLVTRAMVRAMGEGRHRRRVDRPGRRVRDFARHHARRPDLR